MQRRHVVILMVILGVEVAIRAVVIQHAGPMSDQGFYGDDSYMSHQFAADIAAGRGITQAGAPTNGFQPLFVFLLVPFYWFLDIYQATVASAVLNSALSVVGSLLLFLVTRELFGVVPGLIAAGLWVVSAHLTRVGLNGLETALANAMMLLAIWLHVRSTKTDARLGLAGGAGLGAVMGLTLLARLDLGLLLVPLALDQARIRIERRQYAGLATTIAAAALLVAPWFAWSRLACGSFVPVSGAATRTVAQLYGSPGGPTRHPEYFPLGKVPAVYYSSNLAHAGRQIVCEAPLSTPVRAVFGNHAGVACAWLAVVITVAVLADRRARMLTPSPAATRGGRDSEGTHPEAAPLTNIESAPATPGDCAGERPNSLRTQLATMLRSLWFLWVFVVAIVAAYCVYYFAQWHYWRYLTPVTIALMIPSARLVHKVGRWLSGQVPGGRVAAGLCIAGAVTAGAVEHAALFGSVDPTGIARNLYRDAKALDDMLPADARIGSFESGTLDYFLEREVVNLDGKTNARALQALVEGRMDRLVIDMSLDYVVSSPLLIRDLLDRRGQWPPGRLEIVGRLAHNLIVRVNPLTDHRP